MDKRKILLLDDSPVVREGTRRLLGSAGFEVFAVENWAESNRIFYHEKPELLLIDVNLGLSIRGNQIVELYRAKSSPKYSPKLVLYSDMDRNELASLTRLCGADGFIVKGPDIVTQISAFF